jgi:hypothetical protein
MEDLLRTNQRPIAFLRSRPFQNAPLFLSTQRWQVVILDQEDVELSDIEEAEKEARRVQEIARRGALYGGVPSGAVVVVVADEQWRPVFEVPMERVTHSCTPTSASGCHPAASVRCLILAAS